MLPESVTVFAVTDALPYYNAQLVFSDSSKAPYLAVDDVLRDRLGNEYRVTTYVGHPGNFANFQYATLEFITTETPPALFSSPGDAFVYTPGQEDVRPAVRTVGIINTQTLESGSLYTYRITAGWFDAVEAGMAQVGDHILDRSGKVFSVVDVVDAVDLGEAVVQEVHKEGIAPFLGQASLYRPTPNFGFYQGNELEDPERTIVQNRDFFIADKLLSNSSGTGAGLVSYQVSLTYQDIVNRYIALPSIPETTVSVDIIGGLPQRDQVDYVVNGSQLGWNGLGMQDLLQVGDVLRIIYA